MGILAMSPGAFTPGLTDCFKKKSTLGSSLKFAAVTAGSEDTISINGITPNRFRMEYINNLKKADETAKTDPAKGVKSFLALSDLLNKKTESFQDDDDWTSILTELRKTTAEQWVGFVQGLDSRQAAIAFYHNQAAMKPEMAADFVPRILRNHFGHGITQLRSLYGKALEQSADQLELQLQEEHKSKDDISSSLFGLGQIYCNIWDAHQLEPFLQGRLKEAWRQTLTEALEDSYIQWGKNIQRIPLRTLQTTENKFSQTYQDPDIYPAYQMLVKRIQTIQEA